MKKILFLVMLLTLVFFIVACGGSQAKTTTTEAVLTDTPTVTSTATTTTASETTQVPSSTAEPSQEDPLYPDELSADGILSYEKSGNALTVKVTLREQSGKMLSLLLLTDPTKRFTWQEDTDKYLVNLAEITLDQNGNGIITLPLESGKRIYLILTSSSGCYIKEVK